MAICYSLSTARKNKEWITSHRNSNRRAPEKLELVIIVTVIAVAADVVVVLIIVVVVVVVVVVSTHRKLRRSVVVVDRRAILDCVPAYFVSKKLKNETRGNKFVIGMNQRHCNRFHVLKN